MNISQITITELTLVITGDGGCSPRRTYSELRKFFEEFKRIDPEKTYLPTDRKDYTEYTIKKINGTSDLRKVFRKVLHPKYFDKTEKNYNLEEVVEHLNSFLEFLNGVKLPV